MIRPLYCRSPFMAKNPSADTAIFRAAGRACSRLSPVAAIFAVPR